MCLPCQTCYELHDVSTFQNKHKKLKSCDQDSKQFPHNELTINLTRSAVECEDYTWRSDRQDGSGVIILAPQLSQHPHPILLSASYESHS